MTLGYLIRKEFKQFFRNPFLPKLVIAFPVMIMLVIPWIVNMDIKNIRLTVVDKDGSSTSGKLIRTLGASEYFILEDVTGSYPEALRQLEKGRTDAVVEIPGYFEQGLVSEGRAQVQISLNAVNQIKGALGSNYLNAVCAYARTSSRRTSPRFPSAPSPHPGSASASRISSTLTWTTRTS